MGLREILYVALAASLFSGCATQHPCIPYEEIISRAKRDVNVLCDPDNIPFEARKGGAVSFSREETTHFGSMAITYRAIGRHWYDPKKGLTPMALIAEIDTTYFYPNGKIKRIGRIQAVDGQDLCISFGLRPIDGWVDGALHYTTLGGVFTPNCSVNAIDAQWSYDKTIEKIFPRY